MTKDKWLTGPGGGAAVCSNRPWRAKAERGKLEEGQEGAGYQEQPMEGWAVVAREHKQAGAGNWQQEVGQGRGQRCMEGGTPVVGAGTGMVPGMLEEQVQEVELSGGEQWDDLLYLWKT